MRQIIIAGILIVLHTTFTFGQNGEKKNPIDIRLEKCTSIDSNMTTVGMTKCAVIAIDEWDKEMNKNYKLLLEILNIDEKEKLKEAQRQWVIYRDKELIFSYEMFGNMQGTIQQNGASGRNLNIIKKRAKELLAYYELHKFE